jgi:molybdopterin-guanine dinucleotide biosynthesis protein A
VVYSAVVLAGGRGARLGGADKAGLEIGGRTLLERCLAALADADEVVVVGDERPTSRPVLWTRESPPYGGPVAATYAGLDALTRGSPVHSSGENPVGTTQTHGTIPILVVAVDMPEVSTGTVRRLVTAGGEGRDGAVLTDGGRRHLAFVATRDALERVRPPTTSGAAMRDLWRALDLVDVPALGEEAHDIDEPDDLRPGG